MSRLAGKTVVVYGLAKSGIAAVRLLLSEGARVIGLDKAVPPDAGTLSGATLKVGEAFDVSVLEAADLIVVSPGVPLALPELVRARSKGIELQGEVELASRRVSFPLVGITGTNGKSTTTALCGELFRAAGK